MQWGALFKKNIIFAIACLGPTFTLNPTLAAQNLALNGGFELQAPPLYPITHPYHHIEAHHIPHWSGWSAEIWGAGPFAPTLPTPLAAAQGYHYAGLFPISQLNNTWSNGGYRETLWGELSSTLKAGIQYRISMKVARGNEDAPQAWMSITDIGLGFSATPQTIPTQYASFGPVVPVTVALKTPDHVLQESKQWVTHTNDQYLANGTEAHITIGWMNFSNPINTSNFSTDGPQPRAYYFIDDVQVSCIAKPDFQAGLLAVRDDAEKEITLNCGDNLLLKNIVKNGNLLSERWNIQELDQNLNPIPGTQFTTGDFTPQDPQQISTADISLEQLFPGFNLGNTSGRIFRVTRSGYCHDPLDRITRSVRIRFQEVKSEIQTSPEATSYPTGKEIQFTLHTDSFENHTQPVTLDQTLWSIDHPDMNASGLNMNRNWHESGTYQVTATSSFSNGCVSHASRTVKITQETLFAPNAFTPNDDGLNDIFEIIGTDVTVTRLLIFDRWGKKIHEAADAKWDGGQGGIRAPVGTYTYQLEFKKSDGVDQVKTGAVTVL